jgi:chromate transporter
MEPRWQWSASKQADATQINREAHEVPFEVPFTQALWFWLKLGFISFGGPAGQIAIMHTELVERRRWISEQRFLHALNYCMLLPGPEAQQLASYLGWLMHRTWGGVLAGTLFVLPSLLLIIALSWIYLRFGDLSLVAGIFYGLKPAVTVLVIQATHRIGNRALRNRWMWCLAATSFVAIFVFEIAFPVIVLAAGLFGFFASKHLPDLFTGKPHAVAKQAVARAIIDDDTATPEHARFKRSKLLKVLVIGIGLWTAAMACLLATVGAQATLTQMAWFFTKAALLTFGGAYAVLPYVHQGAVETHQWLSATQMIDGLALGETTPGPLIMVVAFVAFLGGWFKAVLGPDALFLGGALAACIVTFFTFLPSFIFILAGGPIIESTKGRLGFTAPLSAITAAVVGVILNLAIFFAYHVIWPKGFSESIDFIALFIGLAMALLAFFTRMGPIALLASSACLGLAANMLQIG